MRLFVIGLVSTAVVMGSAAPAVAAGGTIGAPSVGDPYCGREALAAWFGDTTPRPN